MSATPLLRKPNGCAWWGRCSARRSPAKPAFCAGNDDFRRDADGKRHVAASEINVDPEKL